MARIMIIEDSEYDLTRKYQWILPHNEVHVRCAPYQPRKGIDKAHLVAKGIPESNIRPLTDLTDLEGFDFFLIDGLAGKCFALIEEHLPKDKTYINTGSDFIWEEAQKRGFNIFNAELHGRLAQPHHT